MCVIPGHTEQCHVCDTGPHSEGREYFSTDFEVRPVARHCSLIPCPPRLRLVPKTLLWYNAHIKRYCDR